MYTFWNMHKILRKEWMHQMTMMIPMRVLNLLMKQKHKDGKGGGNVDLGLGGDCFV